MKELETLCATLESVHGHSFMVEIWIDRYCTENIRLIYSTLRMKESDALKIFHSKHNEKKVPFDQMVSEFIAECTEGL